MNTLILASSSERRKRILEECRVRFRAVPARVEEDNGGDITGAVVRNARSKAERVSAGLGEGVVLGADTLVLFRGESIGKPAGQAAAMEMLMMFSGEHLKVYTGLFVADTRSGRRASCWDETDVSVRTIRPGEEDAYLRHLGPFDKAGGFSIEGPGALLFDDIRGSYYNVLGLPPAKLADVLEEAGLSIFSFMEQRLPARSRS